MGGKADPDSLRRKILRQVPDLRPRAVDRLVRMYSEPALRGTESPDPLWISAKVRIAIEEGASLYHLLRQNAAKSVIEIGFAYGYSTIWLLEALGTRKGARHIAIDPFEKEFFHGIGLKQVELLESDVDFRWLPERAAFALPDLIRNGHKADFIFIDGSHRFDDTLVEFYFADKLLPVGGIMAFDDNWMQSIRSVLNFILRNQDYEVVRRPVKKTSFLRKTGHSEREWDFFRSFSTNDGRFYAMVRRLRQRVLPAA